MRWLAWTRCMANASDDGARAARWPRAHAVLLGGVCLLGIALRLSCAGRPYWIDEAWVLNSVSSPNLAEMFHYRDWLQTTPPGLLLILRALSLALPAHTGDLRWLSIACSVLTLLLFARLASRLLNPGFACLACAVFAFSVPVVWNGTELKQYTFDALAMVATSSCGLAYIAQPSRRRLARWYLTNLLFIGVSYSAVLCWPALFVVAVLAVDAPRRARRLRTMLPLALLAALAVALVYLLFVAPQADTPGLADFWADGFFATAGESFPYYARRNLSLLFEFLDIDIASSARLLAVLALSAAGALGLERDGDGNARARARLALMVLPVVATLFANLVGVYPLGEFRMVAFLAPCLVILLARGGQSVAELLSRFVAGRRQAVTEMLGMAASLVMTVYLANALGFPCWGAPRDGGTRLWRGASEILPALHYLRELDALERPLFVHAFYQQLFHYYTRDHALQAPVTFASSGYPCCIPGKAWQGFAPRREDVAREVDELLRRHVRTSLHLLLYARPTWPSRDSVSVYVSALAAHECAIAWRYDTYRVSLLRVECAAGR